MYNPGGVRSFSNFLDDTFDMHQDGWVRSTIHAGWHAGAGVAASLNGNKENAQEEFHRAKEQWDRVDNNKFGKTKDE
jgi:hypothetical protein